ncbi:FAD-dependent oxidoreductase [Zavarzinella formosa]|uniref:FAD-dependent oxidoreductase n=1 Tax=Zavarzinella formosa TaxID=360055 RepID=UPI0002F9BD6E|nr:FAD-dependent oxidoreductase [Zavarzinella formosa]
MSSTQSLWAGARSDRTGDVLGNLKKIDVCIVGGGIAGLTTAYLLLLEGRSVTILESREEIGAGETAYTSAHLSSIIDDGFARVESIRGRDIAKRAYQSHAEAVTLIELICRKEAIDCDFQRVDGFLCVADGRDPDTLDEEEAAANRAGAAPERLQKVPCKHFHTGACLRYANQARFHPLKFMAGLAKAIRDLGGRIFTNVQVNGIKGGPMVTVKLEGDRQLEANQVVVATNSPIHQVTLLHTKMAAYTSYVIAAEIPPDTVRDALIWDTQEPYHYVRIQPADPVTGEPELLIVGGEDHKTGQAEDQEERWKRLEEWARKHNPDITRIRYRWSGQVFETLDGLAFIGADSGGAENVFVVTGDSGMGLTHAAIAGRLLTDLMSGRPSDLIEVYSPSRIPLRAAGTYVTENFNLAAQYSDWITGGDVSDAKDIPAGCGAVIRKGLTKLAVYRDEDGQVHEMSAVCPHMKGVVHWNDGEKTWDCPCHGSRFTAEGEVIHGPATEGLKSLEARKPAAVG